MATTQLPGRSATHDGLFRSLLDRASDPASLLDYHPAITYTNETSSHLPGFPGGGDPSGIAGTRQRATRVHS